MIDMKMSAEEAAEYNGTLMSDVPKYPYGLRLCLNEEELQKLNMPALPAVDQTMIINCRVQVVGVSSNQMSGGDKEDRVELQIIEMEVKPDNSGKSQAERIYGE